MSLVREAKVDVDKGVIVGSQNGARRRWGGYNAVIREPLGIRTTSTSISTSIVDDEYVELGTTSMVDDKRSEWSEHGND